jgi:hypothetical protein
LHLRAGLALAESPANAPKPTKFDQCVASHPTVPVALATATTPASFADEEYHGIDAFVFINITRWARGSPCATSWSPSAWFISMLPMRRSGRRTS